jgi:hypothetical protein
MSLLIELPHSVHLYLGTCCAAQLHPVCTASGGSVALVLQTGLRSSHMLVTNLRLTYSYQQVLGINYAASIICWQCQRLPQTSGVGRLNSRL